MLSTGSHSTTSSSLSLSSGWLFPRPGMFEITLLGRTRIADKLSSGAQIVFRSFISPLFARFFDSSASSGLRGKAE